MSHRGTALVVGASSEIGRAVVDECLDAGYDVELWGRDLETLGRIQAPEGHARPVLRRVDVTDERAVADGASSLPADTSLVVLAAGLFDWAAAVDASPRSRAVIETNLTGAVLVTQAVLPLLAGRPNATLVFIGSGAGTQAYPFNAAYVASKHGLLGYAQSVFLESREQALGVKVSVVNPGLVLAGAGLGSPQAQSDPDSLLRPADVARCVRFVTDFPAHGCPHRIDLQPSAAPRGPA